MSEPTTADRSRAIRGLLLLLPLGFFAAMALLFFHQLTNGSQPSVIPSALIGDPAPAFDLPMLGDETARLRLDDPAYAGKVRVVNFWASWCPPCRDEHPLLTRLAENRQIRLIGINHKDQPANAQRFLGQLGNPYAAIGVDPRGRTGIDWGVYGLPESFIVGADGTIRHKIVGPLSAAELNGAFGQALDAAIAEAETEVSPQPASP